MGELGDAQLVKLVNNLLFTIHLRVAVDAADLAASMGLDPAAMAAAVSACSGDSYAVRTMAGAGSGSMAGAKPYLVKDVAAIRAVADELGLSLGQLGDLAGWVDDPD